MILVDVPDAARTQRTFNSVFAAEKMKPWCSLDETDKSEVGDGSESDDSDAEDGVSCSMADLSEKNFCPTRPETNRTLLL